jgi:pimeloyl-ACP methyl ester carboxylesterase/DNA-binding CsgD family transcriptional regulator
MRAMNAPPVQYVTTSDGFSIAYAVSGDGPLLVFMPPPFSHIQLLWQDPRIRSYLEPLAARFRLIQYDGRGKGMSSRGLPAGFAVADCCLDLSALVDGLGLRDFILLASGPLPTFVAVHYAIESPERVRALVLASPTVDGSAVPQALVGAFAATDWDSFLLSMAGLVRAQDLEATVARLKQMTTQEDWLTYSRVLQKVNLESELPRVSTPTLVLHPRDYILPVDESRKVAAAIPGARLVLVDGTGVRGDAAQGLKAIDDFLVGLPSREERFAANGALPDGLSAREAEVLRLIARGRSNPQIALELVISINTVQNHVSSILAKAGLANRAEASSYAQRRGFGPE